MRAARHEHVAPETLAGLDDERPVRVPRADAVADRHGVRLAFAKPHRRDVAPDEVLGAVGDSPQDGVEVERRGDGPRRLREHLGLPLAPLTLLVQS